MIPTLATFSAHFFLLYSSYFASQVSSTLHWYCKVNSEHINIVYVAELYCCTVLICKIRRNKII